MTIEASVTARRRPALPQVLVKHGPLLAVLVVTCISLSIMSDVFATGPNLVNVLRQVSVIAVLAAGLTLLMASGGIDFSLGSQAAVVHAVTAHLIVSGIDPTGAALAGMILGALIGLSNGLITVFSGVPPFVVTLATATILDGVALIAMKGQSISIGASLNWLGNESFLGLPILLWIAIIVCLAAAFVLRWTKFGREILALGGNSKAARLAGIPVRRHTILLYGLNGFLAGLAGVMLLSRLGGASPGTAGLHLELTVVAAVVIGGTALHGGKATVLGTVFGVLLLGVVANGINLLQVSSFYHSVFVGLVLLLAAVSNHWRNRRDH